MRSGNQVIPILRKNMIKFMNRREKIEKPYESMPFKTKGHSEEGI